MKPEHLSRRRLLAAAGAAVGAAVTAGCSTTFAADRRRTTRTPTSFTYCLNTGTIRGQKLGIEKEIEITAKAGYDGIEPWVGHIQTQLLGLSLLSIKYASGSR